ncbi:MAG: hypothetical protein MKZ98_13045 [Pseudomonadales bacterium]|nr:hypothetical protein [Pseudomonadales bacterium]
MILRKGQFLAPSLIRGRQLNRLLDSGAALIVISPLPARKSGLRTGDDARYFWTGDVVNLAPVAVAGQFLLGFGSAGQSVVVSQFSLGITDIAFSHREST